MGRLDFGDDLDALEPYRHVERSPGPDASRRERFGVVHVHTSYARNPARKRRVVGEKGEDLGDRGSEIGAPLEKHSGVQRGGPGRCASRVPWKFPAKRRFQERVS